MATPVDMSDDKENYKEITFGNFPYLGYGRNANGIGFHGPIDRNEDMWFLQRGQISHGCNRMAGEHIVELSVLYGCAKRPGQFNEPNSVSKYCPTPKINDDLDDRHVTVIEEFDIVPKTDVRVPTGLVDDWDDVGRDFVAVDVEYDRGHNSQIRYGGFVVGQADNGNDMIELRFTKAQREMRSDGKSARAEVFVYPTWDNRESKEELSLIHI